MAFIELMLPTLVEETPEGGDRIHEVMFDGYPFVGLAVPLAVDDHGGTGMLRCPERLGGWCFAPPEPVTSKGIHHFC
jgi:hypothetical protein